MGIWFRYLIWCGLATAIAGFVVLIASPTDALLAYGLITLGLLLLLAGLGFDPQTKMRLTIFFAQRSTQLGTNGLIMAIAVLMIWFCVNALGARFSFQIDLTESGRYTLSSQTKAALKTLDHPLKIWLFQETNDPDTQTFLDQYRRLNGRVQYHFVDPDIDVSLIRRFNVQTRGEIHLEYGDKQQFVQTLTEDRPLTEGKLTNAILRIQGDRQPHFYLLQGHGEPQIDNSPNGMVYMVKALEEQGYRVTPLNLIQTPAIPNDAEIIALIAPQSALLPGEVELLQQHLAQQKSLLILLDPTTNPKLDPLFKEWGIKLDQRILIDGDRRANQLGYGNTTLILTNYGKHPITDPLQGNISIYQFIRPLQITPTENITSTPFLSSDQQTWAESGLPSPEATLDPPLDLPGPIDFGIALEATTPSDPNTKTRLIIIGNTMFAKNSGFNQYLNGDILLNSVNWLNPTQDIPLAIRPKAAQERYLRPTDTQISLISWLAPILFPFAALITSIFLLQRQR
jgi:ABC-type uncharacterized transport system involved in gliding motility auxiliary subunit